jgi:signal transduction histidine kinase
VLRAGIEEILAQPGLSDDHRESVGDLLQQTRRLSSVAENLLLLSRADTGRLALRGAEFDLRKLLEGSLEDARILGAGNNLQIETNIAETLPMNGDKEMISLTVQNLVENAVKYNRPGGKILLSAEKRNHIVQICVGNSGPGIPPERAPNIFERFYRARGDEQTTGHGLGLSIARELARAHGGDLTLTRAQSDWTEFCLRLSASSIHVQTQQSPPATQE